MQNKTNPNPRGFGSDNHAPVHPDILNAILKCNHDHAPSYGTDDVSERALKLINNAFSTNSKGSGKNPAKIESYFVFNGTAANVLSLRAAIKPYQSVLCSDIAHLNVDECASPEYLAHCKLIALPSTQGKINLSQIKESLIRRGDQHFAQTKLLSLTQPTEVGTCYSLAEIREMTDWAHQQGLYIHMDGARFANAAYQLSATFAELTTELGIDILSMGGTKNGFMFGEAIVILNPELNKDFKYIRKQSAQLPSKTRYIAAQFEAYLQNNLWHKIAENSCLMAQRLYEQCKNIPGVEITAPRQSNAVFAKIPQSWIKPLREKYFFYVWNEKTFECRWMTSWDTQPEDIDGMCEALRTLSEQKP